MVRGQLRVLGLAALALALAPAGVARAAQSRASADPKPQAIPVAVAFKAGQPGPKVPENFLGLSFEVGSLAQIASYSTEGDLVTLLRSLGAGVLRFGGVTADEDIAWGDEATPRPPWAFGVLEAGNLRQLGASPLRAAGTCC